MLTKLLINAATVATAFIVASLLEYWVHRLMHQPYRLGEKHRDHHRRNEGQGVIWEFRDYVLGGLVVIAIPWLWSWEIGLCWAIGGIGYAAFSAYAHQLQHENPRKCFWMKMPVHYVHHKYGMWHHNFGLGLDWWDHLFGTYKTVDWLDQRELERPDRHYGQLRWW